MTELKLMQMLDRAEHYFHLKGYYADDARWNVEKNMFGFEIWAGVVWAGSFFFRYDEEDERTPDKQLRDVLRETYEWRMIQ